MIVVNLKGGLGNQLFQYAFGMAQSFRLNIPVKFDLRTLVNRGKNAAEVLREFNLDAFEFPVEIASDYELKFWPQSKPQLGSVVRGFINSARPIIFQKSYPFIQEKKFSYDKDIAHIEVSDSYFDGYWQSEKYFLNISDWLRDKFVTKEKMNSRTIELYKSISETNSICVNVRRGDFANTPSSNSFHGLLGVNYYSQSLAHLMSHDSYEKVFIFSDEPEWCEKNLNPNGKFFVVDHSYAGKYFSHYLKLMAAAKAFVIPNSTFAWWAVWLANPNPKKVIAPINWFTNSTIDVTDLVNQQWVRM